MPGPNGEGHDEPKAEAAGTEATRANAAKKRCLKCMLHVEVDEHDEATTTKSAF